MLNHEVVNRSFYTHGFGQLNILTILSNITPLQQRNVYASLLENRQENLETLAPCPLLFFVMRSIRYYHYGRYWQQPNTLQNLCLRDTTKIHVMKLICPRRLIPKHNA